MFQNKVSIKEKMSEFRPTGIGRLLRAIVVSTHRGIASSYQERRRAADSKSGNPSLSHGNFPTFQEQFRKERRDIEQIRTRVLLEVRRVW